MGYHHQDFTSIRPSCVVMPHEKWLGSLSWPLPSSLFSSWKRLDSTGHWKAWLYKSRVSLESTVDLPKIPKIPPCFWTCLARIFMDFPSPWFDYERAKKIVIYGDSWLLPCVVIGHVRPLEVSKLAMFRCHDYRRVIPLDPAAPSDRVQLGYDVGGELPAEDKFGCIRTSIVKNTFQAARMVIEASKITIFQNQWWLITGASVFLCLGRVSSFTQFDTWA